MQCVLIILEAMDSKSKSKSLPRQTDNKGKSILRQTATSKSFMKHQDPGKKADLGKVRFESTKLQEQSKASSDNRKSDVARQMDQSRALFEGKKVSKLPDQSKPVVESKGLQEQSKSASDQAKSATKPLNQAKALFESKSISKPLPECRNVPKPTDQCKPSFSSKSSPKLAEEGKAALKDKTDQGKVGPDPTKTIAKEQNVYEPEDTSIFDSFPPTHLQYESIGVMDVPNVYTDCDYKSPAKKPNQKKKTIGLKKSMVKPEILKKKCPGVKTILLLVCAAVFVVVLVGNLVLGVIGVTRNCCRSSLPCQVEQVSMQQPVEVRVETPPLPINKEVSILLLCISTNSMNQETRCN